MGKFDSTSCVLPKVTAIQLTIVPDQQTNTPSIVSAKWKDKGNNDISTCLVGAEVKLEIITEGVDNDSYLVVKILKGSEDTPDNLLQTISIKVENKKAIEPKFKILKEWENESIVMIIDEFSDVFVGSETLTIESQFCDPLEVMQIRKNRASNLFGKVRTENNVANSKNHQGFDYYALDGTSIMAVSNGVVKKVVDPSVGDYGKQIVVKIDNSDYYAFYAHLAQIDVTLDDIVTKGAIIGQTGITGNASSLIGIEQHLHFECRTILSPGVGLTGRADPNEIVVTKFYSQDTSGNQTNSGVKKISNDGTETLMEIADA